MVISHYFFSLLDWSIPYLYLESLCKYTWRSSNNNDYRQASEERRIYLGSSRRCMVVVGVRLEWMGSTGRWCHDDYEMTLCESLLWFPWTIWHRWMGTGQDTKAPKRNQIWTWKLFPGAIIDDDDEAEEESKWYWSTFTHRPIKWAVKRQKCVGDMG